MVTVSLDASAWRTSEDVWVALLQALGAPEWHGHNLDALNDSLRGGDLNAINPPIAFRLHRLPQASETAQREAARIAALVTELADGGVSVSLSRI